MTAILGFLLSRNGALSILIVGLLATSCVQTARVKSLKSDLVDAKALLYVPDSKPRETWQAATVRTRNDLEACRGSNETLSGALDRQNAALELMGRGLGDPSEKAADAVLKLLGAS